MKKESAVFVCTCSGDCPGMLGINFIELMERLRLETQIQVLAFHPHLCDKTGINLLNELIKLDRYHLIAACAEERQIKLLETVFIEAGVPMDGEHLTPLNMIGKNADQIINEIRLALQEAGFPQPLLHNA